MSKGHGIAGIGGLSSTKHHHLPLNGTCGRIDLANWNNLLKFFYKSKKLTV